MVVGLLGLGALGSGSAAGDVSDAYIGSWYAGGVGIVSSALACIAKVKSNSDSRRIYVIVTMIFATITVLLCFIALLLDSFMQSVIDDLETCNTTFVLLPTDDDQTGVEVCENGGDCVCSTSDDLCLDLTGIDESDCDIDTIQSRFG